jgi:HSP20 family protein
VRYRRVTSRFVGVRPGHRHDPFAADLLAQQLNRILVGSTRWRPPADVCETRDAIIVHIDLAGMDEDQMEMSVYQDAVVIEGDRRLGTAAEDTVFHLAEIRQGPFRLEIRLPARVDQERIEGVYDRGILTITLPKTTTRVPTGAATDEEPDR